MMDLNLSSRLGGRLGILDITNHCADFCIRLHAPFFFLISIVAICKFSLPNYLQEEVRKLATQFDLPNKDRKDSQGICFLGKVWSAS